MKKNKKVKDKIPNFQRYGNFKPVEMTESKEIEELKDKLKQYGYRVELNAKPLSDDLKEQISNLLNQYNELVEDKEKLYLLSFSGGNLGFIDLADEVEKVLEEYKPRFESIDYRLDYINFIPDEDNNIQSIYIGYYNDITEEDTESHLYGLIDCSDEERLQLIKNRLEQILDDY